MWESDKNWIIYAIGRTEKDTVTPFVIYYRKLMNGLEGTICVPEYNNWAVFCLKMKDRFLSSNEAREAIVAMDKLEYKLIEAYLLSIENLNLEVGLVGEAWRMKVKQKILEQILKLFATMF